MEEANEQIFKGDLWVAQRLRNVVGFSPGTGGEFTFMVKHGLLMSTSEAPRIFHGPLTRPSNAGCRPTRPHRP